MAKKIILYFNRFFVGITLAGLVVWLFGGMLILSWEAKPPLVLSDASILQQKPETHDGKTRFAKCWTSRREGLQGVYLKGSPFEIGYAQDELMQEKALVMLARIDGATEAFIQGSAFPSENGKIAEFVKWMRGRD